MIALKAFDVIQRRLLGDNRKRELARQGLGEDVAASLLESQGLQLTRDGAFHWFVTLAAGANDRPTHSVLAEPRPHV
jgi:hypothetical protein